MRVLFTKAWQSSRELTLSPSVSSPPLPRLPSPPLPSCEKMPVCLCGLLVNMLHHPLADKRNGKSYRRSTKERDVQSEAWEWKSKQIWRSQEEDKEVVVWWEQQASQLLGRWMVDKGWNGRRFTIPVPTSSGCPSPGAGACLFVTVSFLPTLSFPHGTCLIRGALKVACLGTNQPRRDFSIQKITFSIKLHSCCCYGFE